TQQTPNDGKGDPYQIKPYHSSKIISDNKIVWMDNSDGYSQIKMRYINSDPLLLLEADYPSTNGSLLVWSDNRRGNWNIYGFDFFTRSEKPITKGDYDQLYPKASGDIVVYSDYRSGDSDIYMTNIATGVESPVATGKRDQMWPSISGDLVVWQDNSSGNWDIYMKELSTDKTTPIYKGSGQQMYPAISGDLVVWQDSRNGDFDIYVKDLVNGTETKLTGDGDQLYPDISGYTIAWQDATTGDISYYFWDKKWGKTYPREGEQTNPVVSGNYIAYVDGSGEDTSIRKLDLASWKDELVQAGPGQAKPSMDKKLVWINTHSGKPRSVAVAAGQTSVISKVPGDQSHPVVGGNDQVGYYVAWMDNRTSDPDVYVYSLAQELELPLAASPYEDMYPDIRGNIIAWVARNPDNQYQIEDYWCIRTFDISIDNSTELVYGLENSTPISLSDDYLAYLRKTYFGWMVYSRPLYEKETAPESPPSGINVRAGGDYLVFQNNKAGSWDIFLWKQGMGTQPVSIVADPADQINASTDGRTVVWQDNRNGNWDIYAYDLNTSKEMQITTDSADQINPDVENGVIVWQDKRNGDWDIYVYDQNVGRETPICTDPGNQMEPRIRTGRIVWTDDRSGDKDIYIYENYMP
ncbi:MAG: biopolymer transporter Tol, partial [Methanosarcinales archaeon]|nr:biopolymer transporter Tol [Methanosarcinales archaeon]